MALEPWVDDLYHDYRILCEVQASHGLDFAEVVRVHPPTSRFMASALRYQRVHSLLAAWAAYNAGGTLLTLHEQLACRTPPEA